MEVGVSCYWNDYHRLSLTAPLPDIAPLFRECHAFHKEAADVAVMVASGLSEPAAISGNLHRIVERTAASNLFVVTPTATAQEVAHLEHYLYQDRIFGVRLLLGVDLANQIQLRTLLPQRTSNEASLDSADYPSYFEGLRETFSEYRQTQQANYRP